MFIMFDSSCVYYTSDFMIHDYLDLSLDLFIYVPLYFLSIYLS